MTGRMTGSMTEKVVVFGATSAIAQEVAAIYAARGARLFLVGRNPAKLAAVCGRLGGAVVGSRALDLDDASFAPGLVIEAAAALGDGFDVALIAHGQLGDQPQTEADYAAAEAVLTTNFLSAVALLIPIANLLQAQRRGHVAVLSSVAGERGRPRNYTYGAAKGALTIYLQGLRTRLWRHGVGVHTIKLGPVDTPMTVGHRKHLLFGRADRVAADVVRAIDSGLGVAYVPWFWGVIMPIVRALPEPVMQRLSFLSGR
jgi:decaprenylphospho-beta-D-erythro-pentofuranosid-2-ulose 2-reductase